MFPPASGEWETGMKENLQKKLQIVIFVSSFELTIN
jgi:hypothetical protein